MARHMACRRVKTILLPSVTCVAALAAVCLLGVAVEASAVTVRNDVPKLDAAGNPLDSHSGVIVQHGGTFFLYGERYGNTSGMDWTWAAQGAPRIVVHTSPDLVHWTFRGHMLNDSVAGTQWVPAVIFDESRSRFVAWFGEGNWGVAVSSDGIHFDIVAQHGTSRLGGQTDGNSLFIDDDGQGYVIFSATTEGHVVSIERLTSDYLASSKVNVSGFFPDSFVEGAVLFKREDTYYAAYGQCCCACRAGSGFVVFTAPSILGPWTRQVPHSDVNCGLANGKMCTKDFTVPAQGYSINQITTSEGDLFLWMANRWLQGPNNPPKCLNMCNKPQPAECNMKGYHVGTDPVYWAPLRFSTSGQVVPFVFENSFNISL